MAGQQFTQWLSRSIAIGALAALTALPVTADQAPSASGPATASISVQISGAESAGPQRVLTINNSENTNVQVVAVQSAGAQALSPSANVVTVSTLISGAESAGPQRVAEVGR